MPVGALVVCVLTAMACVQLGCAGGGDTVRRGGDDPLWTARRADLTAGQRVRAIQLVKARVDSGETGRIVARHAMTEMAWALDTPALVRAAALEAVLWDEQAEDESLELVMTMLPTEPDRGPVAVMATAIADHGWTDATPALVRSLARPVPGIADRDRAEFRALTALHPDRTIEKVAVGVFLDPQTEPGPAGLRLDMRVREAAWDLVGRLVPDGAARSALLDGATGGDEDGLAMLSKLREVRDVLGVVPSRGEEVRWAMKLADERGGRLAAWWDQVASALGEMPSGERARVSLRHLEPVRWAGRHRAAWLVADRETLLSQLAGRLKGRQLYPRTMAIRGLANANAERLATERDNLEWGDVLTLLVIDEALADAGVRSSVFSAAKLDHDDVATEHGGTIWADADGFHAQSFVPRGSATPDDRRFVAPREMIDYSGAALAHFHFHVTDWRNRDYAGPSPGDLDFATRFGRACVVFTGLSRGLLNADVYFPNGSVIDLGEVRGADSGS
jgi:hypothetical protein